MRLPTYQHSLSVYLFSLGDCTLGGISSKHKTLRVVAVIDDKEKSATRTKEAVARASEGIDNAVVVVEREISGERFDYIVAAENVIAGDWTMMGGNYAHSSDSRWREAYKHPLPIHDRVERT